MPRNVDQSRQAKKAWQRGKGAGANTVRSRGRGTKQDSFRNTCILRFVALRPASDSGVTMGLFARHEPSGSLLPARPLGRSQGCLGQGVSRARSLRKRGCTMVSATPEFELHRQPNESQRPPNRESGLEGQRGTGVARVVGVVEARAMLMPAGGARIPGNPCDMAETAGRYDPGGAIQSVRRRQTMSWARGRTAGGAIAPRPATARRRDHSAGARPRWRMDDRV